MVGHDGWGDGRYGNYFQSPVRLSDQELIQGFLPIWIIMGCSKKSWRYLGDEAAQALRAPLVKALDSFSRVICLTHVPPFKEACWYQGQVGNDDWLPYFACKAVGDLLLEVMGNRPNNQLTVLCGHTHHDGVVQMLPNLRVVTGSAEYGAPHIYQVLEVL